MRQTQNTFPKPASNRLFYSNKNLDLHETNTTTNMKYFFEKYQNIFMKIDIEGGESNLFQSFSDADLLKIRQIVIEFHLAEQIVIPTTSKEGTCRANKIAKASSIPGSQSMITFCFIMQI